KKGRKTGLAWRLRCDPFDIQFRQGAEDLLAKKCRTVRADPRRPAESHDILPQRFKILLDGVLAREPCQRSPGSLICKGYQEQRTFTRAKPIAAEFLPANGLAGASRGLGGSCG